MRCTSRSSPKKGNYVAGKFDQYKRNVPMPPFVQAFDSLIKAGCWRRTRTVERYRQLLGAALGANARLLIDVIPQIELILGEVPEEPQAVRRRRPAPLQRHLPQLPAFC